MASVIEAPLHEITTDKRVLEMYSKAAFPFELLAYYLSNHPDAPVCNEPNVLWEGEGVIRYG